ncbi:MAG: hypothetical protein DMG29_07270 [Acidobacteria bacterium]|nr:MAG: hypothetical protein DMG29_07270 [Acidobacteriota bacterium]
MVHQRLKGLFSVYEKSYADAVESSRLSLGYRQLAVFSEYQKSEKTGLSLGNRVRYFRLRQEVNGCPRRGPGQNKISDDLGGGLLIGVAGSNRFRRERFQRCRCLNHQGIRQQQESRGKGDSSEHRTQDSPRIS